MSAPIPDFTVEDQALVASLLLERYGRAVALELADSELSLDPDSEILTDCPTLFWSERGANFVVCKVATGQYRCQFFYSDVEHFGTGRDCYPDLEECVLSVLRLQADHEGKRALLAPSGTGEPDNDDYVGPTII